MLEKIISKSRKYMQFTDKHIPLDERQSYWKTKGTIQLGTMATKATLLATGVIGASVYALGDYLGVNPELIDSAQNFANYFTFVSCFHDVAQGIGRLTTKKDMNGFFRKETRPYLSTSLEYFWTNWNWFVQDILRDKVYKPLEKKIGDTGAVAATFITSGVVHNIFYPVNFHSTYFFLLQGGPMAVNRYAAHRKARKLVLPDVEKFSIDRDIATVSNSDIATYFNINPSTNKHVQKRFERAVEQYKKGNSNKLVSFIASESKKYVVGAMHYSDDKRIARIEKN